MGSDVVHRALVRGGLATMAWWVDDEVAPDRDALVRAMCARYRQLADRVPWPARRAMQLHLTQSILPGAALYTVLVDRGLDGSEAVDAVAALVARRSASHGRRLSRLSRHRAVRALFLPTAVLVTRVFFPPPGWVVRGRERSRHVVAFDIEHCYILESLTALGMPDLTRAYCVGDDVMYAGLCPQLRWLRTGTLATGAPVCDFRFERHEVPAGDEDASLS